VIGSCSWCCGGGSLPDDDEDGDDVIVVKSWAAAATIVVVVDDHRRVVVVRRPFEFDSRKAPAPAVADGVVVLRRSTNESTVTPFLSLWREGVPWRGWTNELAAATLIVRRIMRRGADGIMMMIDDTIHAGAVLLPFGFFLADDALCRLRSVFFRKKRGKWMVAASRLVARRTI
jgi:hypothetical protein